MSSMFLKPKIATENVTASHSFETRKNMSPELFHSHHHTSIPSVLSSSYLISDIRTLIMAHLQRGSENPRRLPPTVPQLRSRSRRRSSTAALIIPRFRPISAALTPPPLDLTEDNVRQVLADARIEFAHIFDDSVGITGEAELAELDGPFVKISLRGRFWHERSIILARLGNYLKQRIPEILEVDIEDVKQLDDSPENF